MNCPRCGRQTCDCLLEDPGFLARAVGKQLSRLSGCVAGSPATMMAGLSDATDVAGTPCGGTQSPSGAVATGTGIARPPARPATSGGLLITPSAPYWRTCPRARSFGSVLGGREAGKTPSCGGPSGRGSAGMDFFARQPRKWDIAVTNPPYSRKDEFLERAYSLGKPFAFLPPVEALGGRRVLLYRKHGVELLVPGSGVNFQNDDGSGSSGASFASVWFCWRLLPRQAPSFVEADW